MKITIVISIILSLCAISFLVYGNAIVNSAVYAQSDLQTVKNRNLVIDLGNGVKTNAQLTYPANGKGPFPAVLLISGTGANDMNETLGLIRIDNKTGSKIYPAAQPFWQISQYLSERGFAVLRYDKRGIGANYTILNSNVWGNLTANGLVQDAEKALTVLVQQPEIDPNNITLLGHSEGTIIAPRVAIDNPTKAKNIILMGAIAQTESELLKFQVVQLPILYAEKVLDYDHDGLISIQQIAKNPVLNQLLVPSSIIITSFLTNDTKVISDALLDKFSNNTIGADNISIDKQLKPELVKIFESFFVVIPGKKCTSLESCPIWLNSYNALEPNVNIIGSVPPATSILILQGENDSQTPLQQAFVLQQTLTDKRHPDHTLITYPNLGHVFYPSSEWQTSFGPIQPYVLAGLYSWLESHSGLSRPSATTPTTSATGTNTSSLS